MDPKKNTPETDPPPPPPPDNSPVQRGSVRCFAGSDHRLVLKEGGLCDYYSVTLSSKPTSNVEINVVKGNNDLEVDPVKLLITPEQWDEIRTIKVRAIDHPGSDGFSWTTNISHTIVSKDSRYKSPRCSIVPQSIAITVMENDAPYLFAFGDSEYGQTGLNHLDLQPIPKYINFKLSMNRPLEPNQTLSDRNSNRKIETKRPWHQDDNRANRAVHRPKITRPTKARTSMMLRRLLDDSSTTLTPRGHPDNIEALTPSETIANRRTASLKHGLAILQQREAEKQKVREAKAIVYIQYRWRVFTGKLAHHLLRAAQKLEETRKHKRANRKLMHANFLRSLEEANMKKKLTISSQFDEIKQVKLLKTVNNNIITSKEAEEQLLKAFFPKHKTLNDHQNIQQQNENIRLYRKKKRMNFKDIHSKKLDAREERHRLMESKNPPPTHISVLSCGTDHSAMVTGDGRCYTWGSGISGCLGLGEHANRRIPHVWNFYDIGLVKHRKVTDVSCGENHTALTVASGLVLTFGCGDNGRLGHSDIRPRNRPKVVESLRGVHRVTTVVCGGKFTLLLTKDNNVMSCGHGQTGALGHGDRPSRSARRSDLRTFQTIKLLRNKKTFYLSAGSMHSAVLCENGEIRTFGFGESGQLGRYLGALSSSDVPDVVVFKGEGQHNIRLCSCGGAHTLLLDDDNAVWSFGSNDAGQLGTGDRRKRVLPYLVRTLLEKDVIGMAAGARHSAVVCEDGACYLFGAGQQGQLGIPAGAGGGGKGGKGGMGGMGKKQKRRKRKINLLRSRPANRLKQDSQRCDDQLLPSLNIALTALRVVQISCGGAHTLVTTLDHHKSSKKQQRRRSCNSTFDTTTARTMVISKLQEREQSERLTFQIMHEQEQEQEIRDHRRMSHVVDVAQRLMLTGMSNRKKKELREAKLLRKGTKKRIRKRPLTHGEQISKMNKKSTMVKNWLKNRKEKILKEEQAKKTQKMKEQEGYKNLVFPSSMYYETISLRDFVQEIFNGIDHENDGRIRIEMLLKAIQYNKDLVEMLKTRMEVAVLGELGANAHEDRELLDKIDLDHDGWLTVTELLTFAQEHKEEMAIKERTRLAQVNRERKEQEQQEQQEKQNNNINSVPGSPTVVQLERSNSLGLVGGLDKDEVARIAHAAENKQQRMNQRMNAAKNRKDGRGERGGRGGRKGRRPQRPASAGHQRGSSRRRFPKRERRETLAAEGDQWKKGGGSPGQYSQTQILSERKRTFLKMKKKFVHSYAKAMEKRKARVSSSAGTRSLRNFKNARTNTEV